MANGGLQIVGFFLGYIALTMNLCCTLLPFWKMDDISAQTMVMNRKYHGLWFECEYMLTNSGVYTCNRFTKFFLAQPSYIQGSRAFAIISVVLGFVAVIAGIVGMECTRIAEENEGTKKIMGIVSGACDILAGIAFMISTCWYATQILMEFQSDPVVLNMQVDKQWIYGWCLWIGWGSSVISLGGGVLMIAGSLGDDADDDQQSMGFQMGNARLLNKAQNNYV